MIKMIMFLTLVFLAVTGLFFWLKESDHAELKRASKAIGIFSLLAVITAIVVFSFVILF